MDVVMPQLGETVAEGKVATWFKSPGDAVEAGENLFEIETDKVTMEVQALCSGVLSEVRVKSGETAPVGAVVAVIGDPLSRPSADAEGHPLPRGEREERAPSPLNSGVPEFSSLHAEVGNTPLRWGGDRGGVAPTSRNNGAATPFKLAPFAETRTPKENFGKASGPLGLKITPLARRRIAQSGIDLTGLAERMKAKGAWRIGKADVEAALNQNGQPPRYPSPSPSPPNSGVPELGKREPKSETSDFGRGGEAPRLQSRAETLPFNNIRRQTGERLQESWRTIPHVFQAVEVDFAAVEKLRQARKGEFSARHGVPLSYLPFIARAVCIALADFPRVNARLEGDGLRLAADVNLGIAVDLSHAGLVVPVIRNADELSLTGLAKAIARQVEKARSGKLTPDDVSGGTYTISNNGAFGTLFTAPIVNPPQVAILSTDAVRKKPVVVESADGDSIAIRPVGVVAQSFDHRAFDGAYSAAFLARVKELLERRDWAGELS